MRGTLPMKIATRQPLLKGTLILISLRYVKLILPTLESLTSTQTVVTITFWVAEKRVSNFQSAIIVEGFQSLGSTQPPKVLCVVPFPS